jgi:hypothetical protein
MELLYAIGGSFLALYAVEVLCTLVGAKQPSHYIWLSGIYIRVACVFAARILITVSNCSYKLSALLFESVVFQLVYLIVCIFELIASPLAIITNYFKVAEKSENATKLYLGALHLVAIPQVFWIMRVLSFDEGEVYAMNNYHSLEFGVSLLVTGLISCCYMIVLNDFIDEDNARMKAELHKSNAKQNVESADNRDDNRQAPLDSEHTN